MLRLRPYVDRVDNYDALRMTQGLVDYLQNSVRYELGKVQVEKSGKDRDLQRRLNGLKQTAANADRERTRILGEVAEAHKELKVYEGMQDMHGDMVYQSKDDRLIERLIDGKPPIKVD